MYLLRYAVRNLYRNKTRTLVTVAAVVVAVFIFCAVLTLGEGVVSTIEKTGSDQMLIVFQKDRF